MKIGIIGGTFDPIHFGHLNASEEIAEIFKLDRVIMIPLNSPPHKQRRLVDSEHRLNMALLGSLSNPKLDISDQEIMRGGITYTIDTILQFKSQFEKGTELFFITGSDAFYEIGDWKNVLQIFQECHFIVVKRAGFEANKIEEILKKKITIEKKGPEFSLEKNNALRKYRRFSISGSNYKVNILSTTIFNISSTMIRDRIKKGKSIRYLVPREVECYIRKKGLYQ